MNFRAAPMIALTGISLQGCPLTRIDTPLTVSTTLRLAAGDLNGDGLEDLIAGHRPERLPGSSERVGVSALLSRGDGTFTRKLLPFPDFAALRVLLEDLNGDGHLDLAATYRAADRLGEVLVLLGHGDGDFDPPRRVPGPDAPGSIAAADLDGDGHLDLLSTNSDPPGLYTIRGLGDGTFTAPRFYENLNALALATGDVDGDGAPDAVLVRSISGRSALDVLPNDGAGVLRSAIRTQLSARTEALVLADLDQDGALDAITSSRAASNVIVLRGRGNGRFFLGVNYSVAAPPNDLAVGRVDRDRWLDVVTVSPDDSSVSLLLGLPGGRLIRGPQRIPVGAGAMSVVLAEVTGSSSPEIATGNPTAGSVSVLLDPSR